MCGSGEGMNSFWRSRGIPTSAVALPREEKLHWVCPKCGDHNLEGFCYCMNCELKKPEDCLKIIKSILRR